MAKGLGGLNKKTSEPWLEGFNLLKVGKVTPDRLAQSNRRRMVK